MTTTAREERTALRSLMRLKAAQKVQELRDWRQERAARAAKAAREAAERRRSGPRGVDRVPAAKKGNPLQREPKPIDRIEKASLVGELGTYKNRAANHATRRAMGQRGHQRPRRRREMPGAEARRIERNRQSWA